MVGCYRVVRLWMWLLVLDQGSPRLAGYPHLTVYFLLLSSSFPNLVVQFFHSISRWEKLVGWQWIHVSCSVWELLYGGSVMSWLGGQALQPDSLGSNSSFLLPALWSWANHPTSLCLIFITCKKGMVMSASKVGVSMECVDVRRVVKP